MPTSPATAAREQLVFDFDEPCEGGRAALGGKGVGLAEMTRLGAPVPAGFTVSTSACRRVAADGVLPAPLLAEIEEHLARLERTTGKRFGDDEAEPLLLSVRSGAAISMPGMMETILDLGLNDRSVAALARAARDDRFAWDSYRRLIQMYGEVVAGVDAHRFEEALEEARVRHGAATDADLSHEALVELVATFKGIYSVAVGSPFPERPTDQLTAAVAAVFRSWNAPRARVYRRAYGIPDDLGTAVNVMQMVYGNVGADSGTGVCFSRDPASGERVLTGEFLRNAQGEDVVAGIRTPQPLSRLRREMPDVYEELEHEVARLEGHYRDLQDIEFTIEHGRLYLLQTRASKRTATAALRVAVSMVDEGLLDRDEALVRLDAAQLDHLLHPTIDPAAGAEPAAVGLDASPGAASGRVAFDADTAEEQGRAGVDVILVRWETSADDIRGLIAARGVLTAHGGMASHAAVVARGMGKPCIAGCDALRIDEAARTARVGDALVHEGDVLTIDGTTGRVYVGEVPLVPPAVNPDLETVLTWADERRRLRVYANADTPTDARRARELGAEGVGLCRTEHMFMAEDRLPTVRELILAATPEEAAGPLERLLPMQQGDFEGIFEAMEGLPVTIRLLDPPLHEFLPAPEQVEDARTRERIRALQEANPMLGTRGCRLGLERPEIYEMQIRAIVRAAHAVAARSGVEPEVEIMHPLVAYREELARLRELTARTVAEEGGLEYRCGTMIELPRAALRAGELAEVADFFSFGTNDLTQTAIGVSRDDAEGKFLTTYLDRGVLRDDPFQTLDVDGVGELMRIAVERGRASNPELRLGICGEHGGDPRSIAFCHGLELDYVSCSPFRLPTARLAAAQAALAERLAYVPSGG